MKNFRLFGLVVSTALLVTQPLRADTMSGIPSAAEAPFVRAATSYIASHFPTTRAAEKAGFVRYTNEDDTGAVSYANRQWTSADVAHPSQLWYDVHGRLLGADYSVPQTDETAPHLFGIDAARWGVFHNHVHYGLVGPNGTVTYGAVGANKITAAGGDPANPTPADLVKAGVAKSPDEVAFVFDFPAIWDLALWVIPNPDGAFADKNPDVKPVHPAGSI